MPVWYPDVAAVLDWDWVAGCEDTGSLLEGGGGAELEPDELGVPVAPLVPAGELDEPAEAEPLVVPTDSLALTDVVQPDQMPVSVGVALSVGEDEAAWDVDPLREVLAVLELFGLLELELDVAEEAERLEELAVLEREGLELAVLELFELLAGVPVPL